MSDLVESVSFDADADADGRIDGFVDENADGLDDGVALAPLVLDDLDSDGIPDHKDLDSDNDGINDVVEASFMDVDNDGVQDSFIDEDADLSLIHI